ncbi:MAG: hypothetical protein K2X46_08895, partial [Roseomonas sp.]|nr:hypothetical protein [Roseomonas sp.]
HGAVKLRPDQKIALAQEMPYEARIRSARELLSALVEVAQGRVPKAAPPPPKPAGPPPVKGPMPAKKNVFRSPVVPPAPKGAATRPIPFPGRWKR